MRRLTWVVVACVGIVATTGVSGRQGTGPPPKFLGPPQVDPRANLNQIIDPAIDAVWSAYDSAAALDHVRFISQYWRLAGNPGFNATIDRVRARLASAGMTTAIEEYPNSGLAWDHAIGTLSLVRVGQPDEILLSRDKDHVALCINSFSTPTGGVTAPLVDVGRGDRDADYAGKTLKGAIVLGDADAGQLWRRAVVTNGALGVISTALPAYLNADAPGATPTPRDEWNILQWSSVPYDAARQGFGFKASPRAAAILRKQLTAAGATPVSVRVTIASSFSAGPVRTLVAEIPGRTIPNQRVVLAAHIQEPGANDNASGVATLAELATAMATAIQQKKLPAPDRTLTFLFLNEISGSRRWMQDHPEAAKQVRYMFSMDMTGEDVKKTGGSFLVERYPDPGAVWERPWDPHSEWGKGNVRAESLKGDLINDAHLFVARRVARRTGWIVKSNPYEGGSDHTVFQSAGVPSVLDWHFTDRYYHTNFDTPDKTSAAEMRNVGVAAGASAWLLASTSESGAIAVAEVVAVAGQERIALEETEGEKLAGAATDAAAARTREATILAAWRKWYGEAVRSASRLVSVDTLPRVNPGFERLASQFDSRLALPPRSASSRLVLRVAPSSGQGFAQSALKGEIFVCGEDSKVPLIPVRWSTVVLAADSRLYVPCVDGNHSGEHKELRQAAVIAAARTSTDPEVPWRAAQALARLGRGLGALLETAVVVPACSARIQVMGTLYNPRRWQPGALFLLLRARDVRVRREAAYGIGAQLAQPGLEGDLVAGARAELETCVLLEQDAATAGLLLEAIGAARYATDEQRDLAEAFLVAQSRGAPPKTLGAVKGLEVLIRQSPQRPVSLSTRERLRELVFVGARAATPEPGDISARTRRLALMALAAARDDDVTILARAVSDADWQVRRLVAMRLNLSDPLQASIGAQLAVDSEFQVRYELLGAESRLAIRSRLCAPVVKRLNDPELLVAMRAADVLNASCTDLDEGIAKLVELADSLAKPETEQSWHLPSRALAALARIRPAEARKRLAAAVGHNVWQVRAAAAAVAAVVGAEDDAVALAADPVANVKTAAIDALFRLKSPAVVTASIEALNRGTDHQLLRTAAMSLKGTPEAARDEVTEALLGAIRRLTNQADDTSRDPRVAILDRLGEVLRPERSTDLLPFTGDVDDDVIAAARKAFESVVGGAPAAFRPSRRYPYQPEEAALATRPATMQIVLEHGVVSIELLPDVAPVTIARVTELASSGYYNGLTFHRIVPNFVVQGGSPGANEYVGTSRYMRDEVGPQGVHIRGAVGISTRGRDTGDAQLFVDLVDLPRLDRDYTVFGYVRSGMELIDRLLEGATIKSITVR